MGSIIMDDNGSIGLSYMKANTTTSVFPGLYFTGRRACDPLGELPITEVIVVEGAGSQTGTNRNGDYAHGCLDPDGVTIWSTSEYMGGQTGFSAARTRIFSYQIEPCIAAAVSIELVGATNPICANEAITLNATPAYGGDSPQYEWFLNGNALNLNDDNAVIVTPQNGDVITCTMISNEPGLEGVMVTSNEIVLEIATSLEPQVSVASTQEIICEGEEATFVASGVHVGSNPNYQWYIDGTAVGTNNDTLTYSFNATQNVTCTVTSSLSCASPAAAESASFTVTPQAFVTPEVSISVTNDTITAGESITFTATATNAGSAPTFQWFINGIALSGATSSTYTTNTIGNGQTISCRIVGQVPCSAVQTVSSNGITITVEQPNSILDWNTETEVLIYPNPSAGEVTFKSIHAGNYYIVNEAGQLVQEVRLNNSNNYEIKINNLASGTYVVAGQNDFGVVKERLVIVK
jgi:hypothetical protein